MNITNVIIILVIAIIIGIIVGALYTIARLYLTERKSKKQWKEGKGVFLREGENIPQINKGIMPKINEEIKIPQPKIEEEKPSKKDLKNFKKANKELEKAKKKYEKGKVSYSDLKDRFEYYQNQDYYKKVLKSYGK